MIIEVNVAVNVRDAPFAALDKPRSAGTLSVGTLSP